MKKHKMDDFFSKYFNDDGVLFICLVCTFIAGVTMFALFRSMLPVLYVILFQSCNIILYIGCIYLDSKQKTKKKQGSKNEFI